MTDTLQKGRCQNRFIIAIAGRLRQGVFRILQRLNIANVANVANPIADKFPDRENLSDTVFLTEAGTQLQSLGANVGRDFAGPNFHPHQFQSRLHPLHPVGNGHQR